MTITIVATTAQLIAALNGAITGDTIELAPGTYSKVQITGKSFGVLYKGGPSQVYIQSEFATNPAVITDMAISKSVGLSIKDIDFSTATDAVGPWGAGATTPFEIGNSSNIAITASAFSGSPTGTLADTVSGLYITDSTYVHVVSSTFQYLHYAIDHANDNQVTVINNSFSHLFDDGVRGGGTSNITISGNSFTDLHPDPTDTDHPDTIQFWTTNTTKSAGNITVTNNTFTRGADGGAVQGIWITDGVGNVPYYNVDVSNNTYTGTLWHGIVLDDVTSGVVENNTVNSYPDYNSWIGIYSSANLTVESNKAQSYVYDGSTNLTLLNNQVISPLPNPNPSTVLDVADDGAAEDLPPADPADSSAVPEPVTWSLMSMGLALVGVCLRGRGSRRQMAARRPFAH